MHQVIPLATTLYGYSSAGAIMTLVLPLGFFIVVMIAMYFVFTRPHTVPGHQPIAGAKPVAPGGGASAPIAAATGFPTATSSAGTEPLAHRDTPPVVGARAGDTAVEEPPEAAKDEAAPTETMDSGKQEDSE